MRLTDPPLGTTRLRAAPRFHLEHESSPSRGARPRQRRIARAALVCGLELGVAAALLLAITSSASAPVAAGERPPLTTEAVAAAPASYRSRDIQVQGRVAAWPKRTGVATGDLRDQGHARLPALVVPADRQRLRAFTVGTMITVHGSVVIPPKSMRLARRRRAARRSPSAPMRGADQGDARDYVG